MPAVPQAVLQSPLPPLDPMAGIFRPHSPGSFSLAGCSQVPIRRRIPPTMLDSAAVAAGRQAPGLPQRLSRGSNRCLSRQVRQSLSHLTACSSEGVGLMMGTTMAGRSAHSGRPARAAPLALIIRPSLMPGHCSLLPACPCPRASVPAAFGQAPLLTTDGSRISLPQHETATQRPDASRPAFLAGLQEIAS
jgi:hypothetical protein